MVFDAHIYPVDVPGGPQLAGSAQLRELMEREQIDRALLISKDGDALCEHVEAIDGAYALLWVDPRQPGILDRAKALLAEPKFRGIYLNPALDGFDPDDDVVHPLLALAGERAVPVAVHCGHPPPNLYSLPWLIEKAVARFSEVNFVLAHMGYCVFEYHEGAMAVAELHPNVYLEVGGMPHNWRVREAVDRVGAERVLYGSAAPWHHPRLQLQKIRMSDLAPDALDAVLGGNAESLYLGGASDL